MIRLRFAPRPAVHLAPSRCDDGPLALPPELRWDCAPPRISLLLGRRQFLQAAGVALAVLTVPLVRTQRAAAFVRGRFFTRHEFETLEALCDRIIPPDADPGAKALGAARYISRLLTAFDRRRPRIFGGGPFSGRTPFPDNDDGTPSNFSPTNSFRRFAPLTRLQELYWRGEILGSAAVPELAAIDAQLGGAKPGLRDVYRTSLAKVDQVAQTMHGAPFVDLATAQQDTVLAALDSGAFAPDPRRANRTFIDILIEHTLEGCFAPPEYGGNRKRGAVPQGWRMIGLEGDNQPLGYSIFSRPLDTYVERPDHPMSTPNPDELGPGGVVVPKPLTADGAAMQNTIVQLSSFFSSGAC